MFGDYEAEVLVEGQSVKLSLWDTAGQEGYERIRTLTYPKTDIFLLCFSVVNPTSFENLVDKWRPELRHHSPDVPIILVGTQVDLRQDGTTLKDLAKLSKEPVTPELGSSKARQINALKYMECSALTGQGLKVDSLFLLFLMVLTCLNRMCSTMLSFVLFLGQRRSGRQSSEADATFYSGEAGRELA